jgi:hypothetical protein
MIFFLDLLVIIELIWGISVLLYLFAQYNYLITLKNKKKLFNLDLVSFFKSHFHNIVK